jgi:hypothetical protein
MNRKEHLTLDGIQKILAIKAKINLGLPVIKISPSVDRKSKYSETFSTIIGKY